MVTGYGDGHFIDSSYRDMVIGTLLTLAKPLEHFEAETPDTWLSSKMLELH